jgi:hypothetical protein
MRLLLALIILNALTASVVGTIAASPAHASWCGEKCY